MSLDMVDVVVKLDVEGSVCRALTALGSEKIFSSVRPVSLPSERAVTLDVLNSYIQSRIFVPYFLTEFSTKNSRFHPRKWEQNIVMSLLSTT